MSLYSRHKIERESKRFPSRKDPFGWFYESSWVPAAERGFWYRGCKERLAVHHRNYQAGVWRAFAKGMIVQMYNTSPLLAGLLANEDQTA